MFFPDFIGRITVKQCNFLKLSDSLLVMILAFTHLVIISSLLMIFNQKMSFEHIILKIPTAVTVLSHQKGNLDNKCIKFDFVSQF